MTTKWLDIAKSEMGTAEVPGPKHNPRVVGYFRTIGMPQVTDDETAWCAAYVGSCLERSGLRSTRTAWARDYLKWGKRVYTPTTGCIVVLDRGGGFGHVGFYIKHDNHHIWLLGGNQSNAVNVSSFPIERVLGYRMPDEELPEDQIPNTPKHLANPPPIPVVHEQETFNETAARLREEGSRTLAGADDVKKLATGTALSTIVLNVVNSITESDLVRLLTKFWWVPACIILYVIVSRASEVAFARIHDARKGPTADAPSTTR